MTDPTNEFVKDLAKQFLTGYMSHFPFEEAVKDFPESHINRIPENAPWSFWALLEHIRRMFQEIMDYILKSDYKYEPGPYKYWPEKRTEPVTTEAWRNTISEIKRLYGEIINILDDPSEIIFSELKYQPGSGHTLLRQVLMIIDHNSYHMAQFILMRKLLNIWR